MQQYHDLLHSFSTPASARTTAPARARSRFSATRCALTSMRPLAAASPGHHQEGSHRSIIHELLWFLKGDTNIAYLKDNKVTIWDEGPTPPGTSARSTKAVRSWRAGGDTIDQIAGVVEQIGCNPDSRRLIVSVERG